MRKVKSIKIASSTSKGILYTSKNGKTFRKYRPPLKKSYTQVDFSTDNKDLYNVKLNMVQRGMYRRLLYGLKDYTKKEKESLSTYLKSKIDNEYKVASRVLHVLKAKKYYYAETLLLNAIFPLSDVGQKDYDWYLELPKSATLSKLKITTKEIIDEFIRKKLLPKNFYKLKDEVEL